jgi:hypothetical protein
MPKHVRLPSSGRLYSTTLLAALALTAGCGGSSAAHHDGGATGADLGHAGGGGSSGGGGSAGGSSGGGDDMADSGGGGDMAVNSADLITQLLNLTSTCTAASTAKYATDEGNPSTIDICKLNGAFFWKSDMDIDCDGQTTTQCNSGTDDSYFNDTSFPQSDGKPLSAAVLPYIVVPLPSSRFDYTKSDIQPGAAVAVIYNGKLSFGVFGDEGPEEIIGEASYAMAKSLGIDDDPNTGGADSGVTFIVFTGQAAVVDPIEDHQKAIDLAQSLATKLVQ